MKKIICVVCMAILLLSSFSMCFADVVNCTVEQVSPRFIGTFSHSEALSINSKGYATMVAYLRPKTRDSIDEVKVTITLKTIDGYLIKKQTYDASWSEVAFEFQVVDYKQLKDRDSYYIDVTYKCYKDGKILETLNGFAADSY